MATKLNPEIPKGNFSGARDEDYRALADLVLEHHPTESLMKLEEDRKKTEWNREVEIHKSRKFGRGDGVEKENENLKAIEAQIAEEKQKMVDKLKLAVEKGEYNNVDLKRAVELYKSVATSQKQLNKSVEQKPVHEHKNKATGTQNFVKKPLGSLSITDNKAVDKVQEVSRRPKAKR